MPGCADQQQPESGPAAGVEADQRPVVVLVLNRSRRPLFQDEFGPEPESSLDSSGELLITGITRNGLLTGRYSNENRLRQGCSVRIVLIEPSSDAVAVASDRYYAERSSQSTHNYIHQTLRLLAELKRSTGGDLSVRLTSHPLAIGTIAVDASPGHRTDTTALFAEYYTYQVWAKAKFVLRPADGHWFDDPVHGGRSSVGRRNRARP